MTRRLTVLAMVFSAIGATRQAHGVTFKNVANGVWSSGLNSSAVALAGGSPDAHYTLMPPGTCTGGSVPLDCSEDGTAANGFGPAAYVVLGPNGTFPLDGTWSLADDAASGWIGPRANQVSPTVGGTTFPSVGVFASNSEFYVYRLTFNLTALGLDPATAAINLSWASDGAANSAGTQVSHIRLCSIASASDPVCPGGQVPNSGNGGASTPALTSVNITSGFSAGLMALDFVVYNDVVASGSNPSGIRVLVNSATASLPGVATSADVSLTKTDGSAFVVPGGSTDYAIVVSNAGPDPASSVPVNDILPPQVASATWTCAATTGSSCLASAGSGNIATLVSLPAGGSATFNLHATIAPSAAGVVVNTATAGASPGVTDTNLANNTATDSDAVGVPIVQVPTLAPAGVALLLVSLALAAAIRLRRTRRS